MFEQPNVIPSRVESPKARTAMCMIKRTKQDLERRTDETESKRTGGNTSCKIHIVCLPFPEH